MWEKTLHLVWFPLSWSQRGWVLSASQCQAVLHLFTSRSQDPLADHADVASCPALQIPIFCWSASTAREELPKELIPLQPPKKDPYLEFLVAAFLSAPCEVQRKESGRGAHVGIPLEATAGGRRRRVEWARVAPPAWVGKIAFRSVRYTALQSCSEKENEVVPGGQSSVADFS